MGYALDSCPVVHRCCGRVPLRAASVGLGLLGLPPAALLLFLHSGAGLRAATACGLPAAAAPALSHAGLVFGVLLCAIHIVLLIGAVIRSETFCQLYIWSMLAFLVAFFLCTVVLAVTAGLENASLIFVIVTLSVVMAYTLLNVYFIIVVANFRMTIP